MSDHLPECYVGKFSRGRATDGLCICPVLRACEARVRAECQEDYDDHVAALRACEERAELRGRKMAVEENLTAWRGLVNDALDKARDVVVATPHHDLCSIKRNYPCNCLRGRQIAAMDALRVEETT